MKRFISKAIICMALMGIPSMTLSAMPDENETVQTLIDNSPAIKAVSGGVQITVNDEESHTFYIYSITGQLVKTVDVRNIESVDLPRGCYIVKCSNWSKKIVVR